MHFDIIFNILKFTQSSLVLIPYLLNYSPHSLCLSWMNDNLTWWNYWRGR